MNRCEAISQRCSSEGTQRILVDGRALPSGSLFCCEHANAMVSAVNAAPEVSEVWSHEAAPQPDAELVSGPAPIALQTILIRVPAGVRIDLETAA